MTSDLKRSLQARNLLHSGEAARFAIESPLDAARRQYVQGKLTLGEFERRVESILDTEAQRKTEWLE